MQDRTSNPPALHAISQHVSADIGGGERLVSVEWFRFGRKARYAIATPNKLHGAKRWIRCGK